MIRAWTPRFFAFFILSLVSGCKFFKGGSSSTTQGFNAFKKGFYQFTQEKGCNSCHHTSVAPFFASTNPLIAYEEAKRLVDFNYPTESVLIPYSGNSHCGAVPCTNLDHPAIVEQHLIQWAEKEEAIGTDPHIPTYVLGSLPIPMNVPGINQPPAVMRFPFNQLNLPITTLNNAIFEIEIQMINPTTYRVRYPKIGGATSQILVGGIHVYTRLDTESGVGREDLQQGSAWHSLTAVAPIYNLPNPLPNGPLGGSNPPAGLRLTTSALGIQKRGTSEMMTIAFEILQTYVPNGSVPFSDILAIVNNNGCRGCHTGIPTTEAGFQQLVNIGGGAGTVRLITPRSPANSRLWTSLRGNGGNMPLNLPDVSPADRQKILDYINGL